MRGPHVCDNCGAISAWGPGWRWYGSENDLDDGAIARVCSTACMEEATEAEMEQLVRRRRNRAGTDGLVPLRDHRTVTAPEPTGQAALF
ncbi:hypothetical protein ACFYOC_25475 [Nocardiopsis alba]|uniref:hypothetical protein n=1 Tax=Nocardiopsis alba TaxID=53437 RepID=UPI0036BDD39E